MNKESEIKLRPHTYDGIEEYDQRLPNWWLLTLFGAIIFSVGYWCYYQTWEIGEDPGLGLEKQMAANALIAAQSSGVLSDELVWSMSRDAAVVAAGKATFMSSCASCHQPDLSGKIGPNLKDNVWIHGNKPSDLIATIVNGVAAKGMPSWGPVLGKTRIAEVTAFILSHHEPPAPAK